MGIVTDSRAPGEPKDTEGSALFQIYQAFAVGRRNRRLRQAYADGIAWGDAKQMLFERIDREIAPMRERYEPDQQPGAGRSHLAGRRRQGARAVTPFMGELRHAVGLRNLGAAAAAATAKVAKAALPAFKQYRESDGKFYFKLVTAWAAWNRPSRPTARPN
jgi:tryptophanyl-tRNA synthetase